MKTPIKVNKLEFECTCCSISKYEWENLMKDSTRACKQTINYLIKKHLPDLYEELSLDLWNPYFYYKTKNHLILVHSAIEYFIRWN